MKQEDKTKNRKIDNECGYINKTQGRWKMRGCPFRIVGAPT